MILYRVQDFFREKRVRITAVLLLAVLFLALMMWELVYVQYSVVCGILAGTACFWFYTSKADGTIKEFWIQNLPALLLVWLAFLIRSEMLLLTTPFLAAVGIWHWAQACRVQEAECCEIEKKKKWQQILSRENIGKYLCFVLVMAMGLGIMTGLDQLAYRSSDWKQYRAFFDARTEVYDFTWYPDYETHPEVYEENGISQIQYRLIDNYNFGLDETITENTLKAVAAYGEKNQKWGGLGNHIKNALWELAKRSFSMTDAPYICFVWAGYALVLGLMVLQKEKKYAIQVAMLLMFRSIPWFYLIYKERVVDRIAHPLYVIEVMILLGILVKELYDRPLWNPERYYRMAAAGIVGVLSLVSLPFVFGNVKAQQSRREEILVNQKAFQTYAREHTQNYYYLDVYSTVSFVEKMFENVDNSQKNYDIMGGWMCHSPLQKGVTKAVSEDLGQGETQSIAQALLTDGFYFVAEAQCDVSFLTEYYSFCDKEVELEVEDVVGEGENPFYIYKAVEK